jgi:hypothetical protein
VTEQTLGDVASCADVPNGQDLAFTWGCFEPCGNLLLSLLQEGVAVANTSIDLSTPSAFVGKGLAGRLEIGKQYDLRYYRYGACDFLMQQTFVAVAGRNVVELDPSAHIAGKCP